MPDSTGAKSTPQHRLAEYLRARLDPEGAGRYFGRSPNETRGSGSEDLEARLRRQRLQVQRDQARAEETLSELLKLPLEQRLSRVRQDPEARSWSLCSTILVRSHEKMSRCPQEGLELAHTGLAMAEALAETALSPALGADIQGRAWAALANSQRVQGDLRSAAASLRRAEAFLEAGTGDVLEQARLVNLQGALRGDQGRLEECFQLFDTAAATFARLGEEQLLARSLIEKGTHATRAGQTALAVEVLERGLEQVDSQRYPRLATAAIHNLIYNLVESGHVDEARSLLEEHRDHYRQLEEAGHRIDLLRLRWLEAKLAREAQEADAAEAGLRSSREAFIGEGLGTDAALVSLELAALYTEQRRTAEIRQLAEEMLPIFQATDLHREATAALMLFQQAARMEQVTLGLIDRTVAEVRRTHGV